MNRRITVILHMEPLSLSELLFYSKVLAIGTDFAGCFLSPRGYAWIDMSKRTADKSNLQTVDHCLLLTCLKSPGMQANIFRGVPEGSGSYCRCREPGCAQLRHNANTPNCFRNPYNTNRHPVGLLCVKLRVGICCFELLHSAKHTDKLGDSCHSAVRQSLTPEPGFRAQIDALHTSQ